MGKFRIQPALMEQPDPRLWTLSSPQTLLFLSGHFQANTEVWIPGFKGFPVEAIMGLVLPCDCRVPGIQSAKVVVGVQRAAMLLCADPSGCPHQIKWTVAQISASWDAQLDKNYFVQYKLRVPLCLSQSIAGQQECFHWQYTQRNNFSPIFPICFLLWFNSGSSENIPFHRI